MSIDSVPPEGSGAGAGTGAMVWKGTYNAAIPYAVNDVVVYQGTLYVALLVGTGNTPPSSPTFWQPGSSVTFASGKTLLINNSLTFAGTDGTTMTFPAISASVGYLEVPFQSKSASYTTVLSDSGKGIDHPSTDANARTFTIDSNSNVAYPLGTCLTFSNMTSQVISIAITSDTLILAGVGTTGTRSLAQNGHCTARKVESTKWLISGPGLT